MKALKTPLKDLRNKDLIHYDTLSFNTRHFKNSIPRAINLMPVKFTQNDDKTVQEMQKQEKQDHSNLLTNPNNP